MTLDLTQAMAEHGVPGASVAVLRDGQVVDQRAFGVRADGEPGPVAADTLFQACSISKLVTVLGVLRLVEAGRVDLDADVNDVLTGWQVPPTGAWQPRVTVRQIMGHVAGLTTSGFPGYEVGEPLPTTVEILRGLPPTNTEAVRVDLVPGVQFRYAGGGTTVLQLLLEELHDTPVAEVLRELVLAPLAMTDSWFDQPLPERLHDRAAAGHYPGPRIVTGRWHVYPEVCAAGLWTTPADLCRLAAGIQDAAAGRPGSVVSEATAAAMLTAQVPPADGSVRFAGLDSVGLGVFVRDRDGEPADWFGHSGGNEGFSCLLLAHRDGHGAAVMTNSDAGGPVVAAAFRAIAEGEGWRDFVDANVDGVPSGAGLDGFTGTYRLPRGDRVVVTRDGDRLDLVVGDGTPVPCWARDADSASSFLADVRIVRRGDAIVLHQAGLETVCPRLTFT